MNEEEEREMLIERFAELLRTTPFTFGFKVKKKPAGLKIIYECTQEELDAAMNNAKKQAVH